MATVQDLLSTRPVADLLAEAAGTLDTAIATYGNPRQVIGPDAPPLRLFALFSGGHDSLVTTFLTSRHPAFAGVIHINTGIGIPQTRQFVRDTCAAFGWPLYELHPNITYPMLVVKAGFPGPAMHKRMYDNLKGKPLQAFISRIKTHRLENIGLASGIRHSESARRMGYNHRMSKEKSVIWINPIMDFSALDVGAGQSAFGLPRNPVKDALHISGECLCGAFAESNERRDLAFWYPAVAAEIEKLESLVRLAATLDGSRITPQQCRWGWGRGVPQEQTEMFPLCHHCRADRFAAADTLAEVAL